MARTHRGKQAPFGRVIGNYVTLRLTEKTAVIAGQNQQVVDRLFLQLPFRASQVCFIAYGTTGTVSARVVSDQGIADDGPAGGTVLASSGTFVNGTPVVVAPAALATAARSLRRGGSFHLDITTAAASTSAAGGVAAFITGYFQRHISRLAPYAESGQMCQGGPCSGYYDNWPLVNQLAVANSAAIEVCDYIAPYDARLMAIAVDGRGLTTTTGAITLDVQKNAATVLAATLDFDVNQSIILDNDSTPAFASSAARDIAKGDSLTLNIAAGLNDVVPINAASAHLLVWCKGHVQPLPITVED